MKVNLHMQCVHQSVLLAAFTILMANVTNAGQIVDWQAVSGNRPDETAIPWTPFDNADPELPSLTGGILTLSTSSTNENMYYVQTAPLLDTSSAFFIEARVRYVSGSTTNSSRAPIAIAFTTNTNLGNALFIDDGQVFFNTGNLTAGPKVDVNTNSFHTYRINYDGAGNLQLLYDGAPILTGSTFNDSDFNGANKQISWGETSSLATGTSEWLYFQHSAGISAVPEPSSLLMFTTISCGIAFTRRVRRGRKSIVT